VASLIAIPVLGEWGRDLHVQSRRRTSRFVGGNRLPVYVFLGLSRFSHASAAEIAEQAV
jgi:hypothetical protein